MNSDLIKKHILEKKEELKRFNEEIEIEKKTAQDKIVERGDDIIGLIERESDREIKNFSSKHNEKMKLLERIEEASKNGDMDLVSELMKTLGNI